MDCLIEEYVNIIISLLFSGIIKGVFLKILIKVMIKGVFMKDIIEVYSDAIISVICAVAVITLFVNIMTEYKDIILAFLNQIIYR